MKVIVGLGNPGPQYHYTRHNVGFRVLDCLAERLNTGFTREKYRGLVAEAVAAGHKVLLVKPLTFMNNSGYCVARATRNNIESPADLLVIVDCVHLPLGKLRLRRGGSPGGHKGVKSVIERLGTEAFARLRLGIGEDTTRDELTEYVLGRFRPEEKPVIEAMIERAADAVECMLTEGLPEAMNRFNG